MKLVQKEKCKHANTKKIKFEKKELLMKRKT
jgi:hypothetical protein